MVPPNHTKVKDFEVNIPDDSREPLSWVVQNDKPTTSLIGIVKVDSETGDVVRLAGATFKIKNLDTDEYVGFWVYGSSLGQYVTEFTTNKDGNAMTPGTVRAGHYVLEEIKAPDGMLIAHESKPFTISDDDVQQIAPDGINYITTVQFADAPAKGQLVLEKTADIFQGYEAKETEYGTLYQPVFEEGLLANVTYEIRAREDIKSADGTRIYHYRGDLVERITTNGRTTTKSSRLPLGAYTVQEIACDDPSYVIDSNIYEFDLIYKDQETPVVKQTMKLYDDRKQGTGTITKVIEDSEIIDNSDVYEDIKFGVFTANNLLVNGSKVLNKDSMIQVVSLDDMYKGKVQVDFAGSYYLRELATNDQYVLSNTKIPFNFNYTSDKEIVININNGQPIENKVKRGDIRVLKRDSVTGNPVAGAVFEFSRDKDFENILATVTSDENGIAKLENVEKSTVYVREKTAPDGYAKNTSVKKAEIEDNGQVIEFTYDNEPYRGWIKLHKTDIATKDNLAGIIYKVIADEDIYAIGHPVDENGNKVIAYHKGDIVDTGISENGLYATDETGTIYIGGENGLPMGKYAIFEVETLEGYVLDPLQHIVTISPDSETSGVIEREVYADNDFTKVEVSKTDITTHEHIKGATMQIINKDNGKVVYEWISDGTTKLFERVPVGDYILHEEKAPENSGYLLANDIEFTVQERTDIQSVEMKEDYTKFDFSKTDITTGEEIIGATLQIKDKDGNVIHEWVTDGKPHRINHLPINEKYILHEEIVADGYIHAADIEFTVEETGEIQKVEMKDDYTKFDFSKTDITTGEEIIGATLQIKDKEGNVIHEWVTDGKPHRINYLPINETYTLHEEIVADGYIHAADIEFTVEETGKIQKVEMKDDYTKFDFSKTDITTGEEIIGATLQIKDKDGNVIHEWVTDGKPHRINYLPINEKYILHEEIVADGYIHAADIEFTVEETGEIQKVEMKDDYTKFDFSKTDITTGEEIIGATLQIKDKDGNVIHEWVTDGKPHRINYLPINETYTLHEEIVADGYVWAEDIEFEVQETGEIQKVEMKDDYTRTNISKVDKESGKLLAGAHLQLYYVEKDKAEAVEDGSRPLTKYELIDEWVSGNEPKLFERLKVGNYVLHEKKAPYGYETTKDITFEVVASEKPLNIKMEDIQIRSYIKIKKVDEDNHNKVLSGVEFTLFEDEKCTKPIVSKTTNDNGEIIFDNLTYQTLYVKETKAAAGYQLSNEVVKVEINDEWLKSDKTLVFGNKLIPSVPTGDNSNLAIMVTLFVLSGFTILFMRKKKEE